jgi:hypothetical protein
MSSCFGWWKDSEERYLSSVAAIEKKDSRTGNTREIFYFKISSEYLLKYKHFRINKIQIPIGNMESFTQHRINLLKLSSFIWKV